MNSVVPEIEIQIASSLWLWSRHAMPIQYSIAKGKGIDSSDGKVRLFKALDDAGIPSKPRRLVPSGPDIVAISKDRFWQIECKGSGEGKQSTQRNSFDRAVASVVSYYVDHIEPIFPEFGNSQPTLGLAVPATRDYLSLLRSRVPTALRKRLELWILLYEPDERSIRPIEPDHDV